MQVQRQAATTDAPQPTTSPEQPEVPETDSKAFTLNLVDVLDCEEALATFAKTIPDQHAAEISDLRESIEAAAALLQASDKEEIPIEFSVGELLTLGTACLNAADDHDGEGRDGAAVVYEDLALELFSQLGVNPDRLMAAHGRADQ
jgi:hypothetical protein